MEPDDYKNYSSLPITALSAWMTIANIERDGLAALTELAKPTITSARKGESIRRSTAKLIAAAVKMDVDVIAAGDTDMLWKFRLHTDMTVEVIDQPGGGTL